MAGYALDRLIIPVVFLGIGIYLVAAKDLEWAYSFIVWAAARRVPLPSPPKALQEE